MAKLAFPIASVDTSAALRDQPMYTVNDAAGYLNIPKATINSWFFGTTYRQQGKPKNFAPVLTAANESAKLLSFNNLVESYVLRMLRKEMLDLRMIGQSIDYARKELGVPRPLIHEGLFADNKSLFLKHAGKLVGLDRPEQLLLPNAEFYFKRIKYSEQAAAALFPVTRLDALESPQIVSISPDFSFGRSVIDKSKVATSIVFERYLNGDSVDSLCDDYSCQKQDIEEAIRAEWIFARGTKIAKAA